MLTKYVYNTTNELTLLSIPWFVTGFTDAEWSFIIAIRKALIILKLNADNPII
jgi:hypothetical protein